MSNEDSLANRVLNSLGYNPTQHLVHMDREDVKTIYRLLVRFEKAANIVECAKIVLREFGERQPSMMMPMMNLKYAVEKYEIAQFPSDDICEME